ncbi:hypothetical protein DFH09DRAFT_1098862 [Mycena vulgaris]|nr:hypothetical protein DFH09DRAFT_1098862 [Mycena vulgaris]
MCAPAPRREAPGRQHAREGQPGLRRAEHEKRIASSTDKCPYRRPAPDLRTTGGESKESGEGSAGRGEEVRRRRISGMGKGREGRDVCRRKRKEKKGSAVQKKGKGGYRMKKNESVLTRLLRLPPLIPSPAQKLPPKTRRQFMRPRKSSFLPPLLLARADASAHVARKACTRRTTAARRTSSASALKKNGVATPVRSSSTRRPRGLAWRPEGLARRPARARGGCTLPVGGSAPPSPTPASVGKEAEGVQKKGRRCRWGG